MKLDARKFCPGKTIWLGQLIGGQVPALVLLVVGCLAVGCRSSSPPVLPAADAVERPVPLSDRIICNPEAVLSASEVRQVVELARQCGVAEPAEVETFALLPGKGFGIAVQGAEHLAGRNTTFDRVSINKKGWAGSQPAEAAKWVGDFWADEPKQTILRRAYVFRGQLVNVTIGAGVSLDLADVAISRIAEKPIRFDAYETAQQEEWSLFELLVKDAKPKVIKRSNVGGLYLVYFDTPGIDRGIVFKQVNGRVVIMRPFSAPVSI